MSVVERTLYDALLHRRLMAAYPERDTNGSGDLVKQALRNFTMEVAGLPVIEATNVSDYYWQSAKERWSFDKDFPNIAPPFERFWIEARAPRQIYSDEMGISPWKGPSRWGALVASERLQDGWLVQPFVIVEQQAADGTHCALPLGFLNLLVGEDGEFHDYWDKNTRLMYLTPVYTDYFAPYGTDIDQFSDYVQGLVKPLLLAICFMHCRNVSVRDVQSPRHERRRADRTGEPHGVTYKVLDIAPMQKVLEHEGGATESGIQHALHICRGHFKRRKTGTYWWNSHLRGSSDVGTVVKDYRVAAPSEVR